MQGGGGATAAPAYNLSAVPTQALSHVMGIAAGHETTAALIRLDASACTVAVILGGAGGVLPWARLRFLQLLRLWV